MYPTQPQAAPTSPRRRPVWPWIVVAAAALVGITAAGILLVIKTSRTGGGDSWGDDATLTSCRISGKIATIGYRIENPTSTAHTYVIALQVRSADGARVGNTTRISRVPAHDVVVEDALVSIAAAGEKCGLTVQ